MACSQCHISCVTLLIHTFPWLNLIKQDLLRTKLARDGCWERQWVQGREQSRLHCNQLLFLIMTLTTLSLAKLSECYTDVPCHLLACETYYCCVVEGHLR